MARITADWCFVGVIGLWASEWKSEIRIDQTGTDLLTGQVPYKTRFQIPKREGVGGASNPSTRQEHGFTEVFLKTTRQVTRQEPSGTRQYKQAPSEFLLLYCHGGATEWNGQCGCVGSCAGGRQRPGGRGLPASIP